MGAPMDQRQKMFLGGLAAVSIAFILGVMILSLWSPNENRYSLSAEELEATFE